MHTILGAGGVIGNVYMYGKVTGAMTEETPFNPSSRKGEIRAKIATMLLDEINTGRVRALIARSADFYGPAARTSVANILVFDKLARREKAACLVNDSVPHSFTFTPDAGKSLAMLATSGTVPAATRCCSSFKCACRDRGRPRWDACLAAT